jgi:signal transduction histidine kinase
MNRLIMVNQASQYVFLSYSTKDHPFADSLQKDLSKRGIKVWIDQEGLSVGTPNWERAIRDAIRDCRAVILIASPNSYDSRYVQGELEIAKMYKHQIFPIWARGDDDKWVECVPLHLIKTQYVDMRGPLYSGGLRKLIGELKKLSIKPQNTQFIPSLKTTIDDPRNPFKGLRAFTETDTQDFFGREKFIDELLDNLRERRSFLSIVGPSGSGKSSIVLAGLIPKLRQGAIDGSDKWLYLDPVMPGADPIESLAFALYIPLDMKINAVIDELKDSARSLYWLMRTITGNKSKCLLFIDQVEELWTQTLDDDKRSHFINLVTNAADKENKDALILVALRGDFYDRPMTYPALGKLIEKNSKSVLPMDLDDLRNVIEKPTLLPDVGVRFEDHLVGDLLYEIRGESGALPLLQFTLDQLFRKRSGNLLTRNAYSEIGGVRGALTEHAELTYRNLPSDDHRDYARLLFLRLIEPGTTEQEITRRRAYLNELILTEVEQNSLMEEVKDTFIGARLLTAGNLTIEVSHEALIREWARLAEWIKTAREDIRFQQFLSKDAREWVRHGKRTDDLYRGMKLSEAKEWAVRNTLSKEEQEFIEAALNAQTEEVDVLRAALEKEREFNELRSRFTSMASHEFRNPLAVIISSVNLLIQYHARLDPAKQQNYLQRIKAQVDHLTEILDDVLTLEQANTNRLEFNPTEIHLDAFVEDIIESFRRQLTTEHVFNYMRTSRSNTLDADPRLLNQILTNLISNAVKYSSPGTRIEIQVSDSEEEVYFKVKDEGHGIPEADRKHLFEPFHRATNVGNVPGSGLGLAIVKRAIEAHSGRIEIESQLEKGSTFTVIFPKQIQAQHVPSNTIIEQKSGA